MLLLSGTSEKKDMQSPQAERAAKLKDSLPKEVREALETMQRAVRVRRVYSSAPGKVRYEHTN